MKMIREISQEMWANRHRKSAEDSEPALFKNAYPYLLENICNRKTTAQINTKVATANNSESDADEVNVLIKGFQISPRYGNQQDGLELMTELIRRLDAIYPNRHKIFTISSDAADSKAKECLVLAGLQMIGFNNGLIFYEKKRAA